jgi:small subunit ribosomal protein S1
VTNFGAFAELEDGVEGLIHLSELSHEKVEDPEEVVSVGQELEAKIIKIDAETHKIGLSIRAFEDGADHYSFEELNRASSTTVTLGDMVPEEMSDLRSALAEAEAEEEQKSSS